MSSIFGRNPFLFLSLFHDRVNLFLLCVCVGNGIETVIISSGCFMFFRVTGCGHTDFNQSILND